MPVVRSHPAGTPCWVDLSTPDQAGAQAFYGGVLGWDFTGAGEAPGDHRMCAKDGEMVAGIGEVAGAPPAWTVYLAAPGLDELAARAQAAGAEALSPMLEIPPFGRMVVLRDPTGAPFGLWEPGVHHGAGRVAEPGAPAWHEVNTRDAVGARDFYAGLFGHAAEKMPEMDYHTLHPVGADGSAGAASSGILQMTEAWEGIPPHWMVYFAVESADAAAERVGAHGGTVRHGPFDTPFGRILVCTDPQGAAFTLIQLPGQA